MSATQLFARLTYHLCGRFSRYIDKFIFRKEPADRSSDFLKSPRHMLHFVPLPFGRLRTGGFSLFGEESSGVAVRYSQEANAMSTTRGGAVRRGRLRGPCPPLQAQPAFRTRRKRRMLYPSNWFQLLCHPISRRGYTCIQ